MIWAKTPRLTQAKLLEVVILQCQDSTSVVRIQFEWTAALFASLIVLLLP